MTRRFAGVRPLRGCKRQAQETGKGGAIVGLDREKFRKVLALAESENDSEALAALQSARRLLAREGLRFSDLVDLTAPGFWSRRRAGLAGNWTNMAGRPGFRAPPSPDAALLEEMAELREKGVI